MTSYKISTSYKFFSIKKSQLKALQKSLFEQAEKLSIKGLVLLSPEGLNASFCGTEISIEKIKKQNPKPVSTRVFLERLLQPKTRL